MPTTNKPFSLDLRASRHQFERVLLKQVVLTCIVLVGLEATFLSFRREHVLSTEFLLDVYLTLSVVLLSGAVWHLKSYGDRLESSHLGMMTGMTLGMQTGMMVGIILGATDGFFVGALITMIIASTLGAIGGTCSGIAGVLEGLMAGSMGGIMGAMTGTMLQDDLFWFMPPFMILNFIIMFGLVYMVATQASLGDEGVQRSSPKFLGFFLFNLLALSVLTLVVNLAPPGSLGIHSETGH